MVSIVVDERQQNILDNAEQMNININGVICTINRTNVKDIYIGVYNNSKFLYSLKENKVIGRSYSEMGNFSKYEKDGKIYNYAKVLDVISVDDELTSTAILSFFINEKNEIVTPIHCSLDPHNKFISTNYECFNYDELVFAVKTGLMGERCKQIEDETMQLKLSYKGK